MINNQLSYQGKMQQRQLEGNRYKGKTYQELTYDDRQLFLYRRLMYGIDFYAEEEVKKMSFSKKKRITSAHQKAQRLIEEMKRERVDALAEHLLTVLFPKSPLAKGIATMEKNFKDGDKPCRISMKSLKIKTEEVVEKFIENRLLPKNFYTKNLTLCKQSL